MVIIESPKMITVSYSNLQIPVTVWFEERNRLRVTVQPDKSIVAKAPLDHSMEEVQAKLEKIWKEVNSLRIDMNLSEDWVDSDTESSLTEIEEKIDELRK